MERTDSVGATSITCNNPGFTFYYMIILFPINCLPDTTNVHLFWRGKHINVTVKVKFSAFRTICGFNFIPWKRVIFFYMGSFYSICQWTFIQWYVYIAFRRQHLCPFHFHLFCFEANINIKFPELHHPFTDTYCSIIQVFFIFFVQVCLLVDQHRYFHFMFIFRWSIL